MSIVVVMPSRGRPTRAREAARAARATAHLVSTRIIVAVDADDPTLPAYRAALAYPDAGAEVSLVTLYDGEGGNLTNATNTVSMRVAKDDPEAIIGNLGDDQIARTPGWDKLITEAMHEPGFIYGDDLFQGAALPCGGIFIHAEIVNALGYYALPVCEHLFIDNAWGDLGRGIGRLAFVPEVVFEHVHPLAGKAEWDEGYERANNQGIVDRDRTAYEAWRETWLPVDVQRIREALNVRAGREAHYPARTA